MSTRTTLPTEKLAIAGGAPVRTTPLPWELPGAHWIGEEELEMVSRVIKARSPFRYYGLDPQHMVDKLEAAWRTRLNRKFALATSSGTAALTIALNALDVGPGDEVLVPGYLWVSCLSAIVRLGAIPRLVDIDDTFCVCPKDLATKITPRSKVLLLIHMSGAPGDLDPILAIAREHGIKILEDCAQANGAKYKDRFVGTFGDMAIFSFQLNKNMSSGEGGMLVCDDEPLYMTSFAAHDMGYARNAKGRLDPNDERYQLWGIGSRMSEITAAMALAQLDKLDKISKHMHTRKWQIRNKLSKLPGISLRRIVDPEGDSGPFLIGSLDTPELCRDFVAAVRAEGIRGTEGSLAFLPMEEWGLHWHFNNPSLVNHRGVNRGGWPWTDPANAFAKDYDYGRGSLPNCSDFASRSFLLTIASCLTDQDVADIVHAFTKVARQML